MIARHLASLLLLLPLHSARAATDEPTAFACSFTTGITYSYEKGEFASEKASRLDFGIAGIDRSAQTADLSMDGGKGNLRVMQGVSATHFIEVATEGYMHVTTIYEKDEGRGSYPAVHSRHFGILGQPVVTHYQGFCRAKE
jgi:hypothetical protein